MGLQNLISVHYVYIDQGASHPEMSTDNGLYYFDLILLSHSRIYFPLHRSRVSISRLNGCNRLSKRKRSTVLNKIRHRIGTMGYRRSGTTSIWRCTNRSTEADSICPREESRNKASSRLGFVLDSVRKSSPYSFCPCLSLRAFLAVATGLAQNQSDLFIFISLKILIYSFA